MPYDGVDNVRVVVLFTYGIKIIVRTGLFITDDFVSSDWFVVAMTP